MAINRPLTVLFGWVLLAVLMGIGTSNLFFRGDFRVYFEETNPQFVDFKNKQDVFSKSENVSFLVVPESDTVFNPRTMALLVELTDLAWQTPMSSRAQSIINHQHTYSEYDDLIVEDLVYDAQLSDEDMARVRQIALAAPELNNRLVSAKGDVAVVDVIVNMPDTQQTEAVAEIALYARGVRDQIEQSYPDHKVYLSGIVMMNYAFAEEAQKDASTLVPIMFVVIAVTIALLSRSLLASVTTMVVVALTVVITMGFSGHMGFYLSTATVNVPTIITTLAVADCIHLIVAIKQGMQRGLSREEAIKQSLDINFRPIVITSVTTAIGFLTLNFSEVPILADLGNLSAFGVGVACLLSLTLVPAAFMLFKINFKPMQEQQQDVYDALSVWVSNRYKRILPYSIVILAISIFFLFDNKLNDVAVKYFAKTSELGQAVDQQEKYIGGMSTIDFVINTGEPSGLNRPQTLYHIEAFTGWLRSQPEVDHVFSLTDTLKRLNKNMHSDDDSYYAIPNDKELAAQYLLLYEMSLPYGLDLNNQVDIEKSSTRIVATLQNLGSKEFTEFEQRAKAWYAKLDPNTVVTAASPALMFAHIGETNMESMVTGSVVAILLISALLVFALKSWRLGAISLLPNLLPAAIGFGIWGLMSGEINLGLSVVLSMTMGIIVDDSVHFLSKYQHARASQKSVEDSVRYAFNKVGQALVITTLVLSAGFGVLTLSAFALNADMGLMTVIIIIVALVVDLLFLPAFLLWLDKDSAKKEPVYAS